MNERAKYQWRNNAIEVVMICQLMSLEDNVKLNMWWRKWRNDENVYY